MKILSFSYNPIAFKVADTYQNYNTGGTRPILSDNDIVQFKNDTDKAFRDVQDAIYAHVNELNLLRDAFDDLVKQNSAAFQSLAWIEQHYPEAMHALDCTMKVHAVLDKANQSDDGAVQAP
jgi:hypothetical protein